MKNISIAILILSAFVLSLVSCEDQNEPKAKTFEKPFVKDESYYANLRAYKKTKHQLTFGWFGGWTGLGPSLSTSLWGVPDSVDIIAIWGDPVLDDAKIADLKRTREIKGTKVVFTTLLSHVGKGFPADRVWPRSPDDTAMGKGDIDKDTVAIAAYAEAIATELVIGRGYDGFDIDYEPTVGGAADVAGCPRGDNMRVFVEHLGKYIGPASPNPHLLLILDGEFNANDNAGLAKYYSYCVAQAYSSGKDAAGIAESTLQSKCTTCINSFKKTGYPDFTSDRFIVTENFESYWQWGGGQKGSASSVTGTTIPTLMMMAYWQPTQGMKGGCGSYHMEYEYDHPDMEYKYLRQATQIMNPAIK